MLTYGVLHRTALGVPFRITSPARTVVDCFRYRNKFGIDVALEALDDVLRSRTTTVDEIMRAAEACRARTVMRTYLEALSTMTDRQLRNIGASVFVRSGPGTVKLTPDDTKEYARTRFPDARTK